MDSTTSTRSHLDGLTHYRVDGMGIRVVVLPATCKLGKHFLPTTGYRAVAHDGELHLSCNGCGDQQAAVWHLGTTGPSAGRAELDDTPYADRHTRH